MQIRTFERTWTGRIGFQKAVRTLVLSVAFFTLLSPLSSIPVSAATFAEDAQSAAASGSVQVKDIGAIAALLSKFKVNKLGALKLTGVKYEDDVLKADVKFINIDWRFVAYSGGTVKNTFFTFGPKTAVSLQKMFQRVPGIELMDILVFDDQMLALAGADLALDANDLPAGARAEIDRFYEDSDDYMFEVAQGVKLFGALDMGESKTLKAAIEFLGGKSSKVQLTADLSTSILDAMLGGTLPEPALAMTAALPTFRPKIGGLVQLPANVQFSFHVGLTKESTLVGIDGATDFQIDKQTVAMHLAETITVDTDGAPEISIAMTVFDGEPWEKAFGVKFLTIEDYTMEITADASGTLSVGTGGKTSIGDKLFDVAVSAQIGATTAGLPIPQSISLEINDGPTVVGQLTLRDMISMFNEMLKADGSKTRIPLDAVPNVAIAGLAKGEGPKIEIRLEASGDSGIDIAGKLRILDTDIATVDKAFIKAGEGIEIRAQTTQLKVGPIKLPSASAEVVLRIDQDAGTIPTPRVLISSDGIALFGAERSLDLTMYLTDSTLVAQDDFGDLFKFDFRADASLKGLDSFKDLSTADFRLKASLQSDPGKFIRKNGEKAVKKAFEGLKSGFKDTLEELDNAQKKVDDLQKEIDKQRKIVGAEREVAEDALSSVKAQVEGLQTQIDHQDDQITHFTGQIKSCNQKASICYAWKLSGGSCKKKKWGVCYSWYPIKSTCTHHKNVPDLPAIAVCEAKNAKPITELGWAETQKAGLIATKEGTEEALQALIDGLETLPVDLDPRVAGPISLKELADGALEALKETVKGVGKFADLLAGGASAVGNTDVFVLEKSSIQGSLKEGFNGKPVVLDMNYRLFNKSYTNRIAFSLTDQEFNVKQFEVIALAAATKHVIDAGKKAKIIPHILLEKVSELYLERHAEVDALLKTAVASNGHIETDPESGKSSVGQSIAADNKHAQAEATSQRKKKMKEHKNAHAKARKLRGGDLAKAMKNFKSKLKSMFKLPKVSSGKFHVNSAVNWKNGKAYFFGSTRIRVGKFCRRNSVTHCEQKDIESFG